jgi:hypothetical protein
LLEQREIFQARAHVENRVFVEHIRQTAAEIFSGETFRANFHVRQGFQSNLCIANGQICIDIGDFNFLAFISWGRKI